MTTKTHIARRGFTIIELLVSMALIILIMAVLSEAFVSGLGAFRQLKGLGDMQERIRVAAVLLRRDLAANHFEGYRKLSDFDQYWIDPNIGNGNVLNPPGVGQISSIGGRPQQGFFRIQTPPGTVQTFSSTGATFFANVALEGVDSDTIPSYTADPSWSPTSAVSNPLARPVLHFASKLVPDRKDALRRDLLFSTPVPPSTTAGNSFIDQVEGPPDFRQPGLLNSPWAEIAWFVLPSVDPVSGAQNFAGSTPLYSLYRRQRIMIAPRRDTFLSTATVPGPGGAVGVPALGQYYGVSVEPDPTPGNNLLLWNTEYSVAEMPYNGRAVGRSMMLQPQNPPGTPSTLAANANGQFPTWYSAPIPVGSQANNGFPTNPLTPPEPAQLLGDDLVTTDVISFEIKVLRPGDTDFRDLNDPALGTLPNPVAGQPPIPAYTDPVTGWPGTYDTATTRQGWLRLAAIKIIIRVWDFKTQQARQVTVIQDL
jgi:prepilin-type N-terminal cleavage/methylation domain-containing protein